MSDTRDFTPEQRARFEDFHWKTFNWWLNDIAETREIPVDELEKLALGRVWTGRQAKDNGLIDELGDLHRAIELAKAAAGIPAEDKVTVEHYPKKKSPLEVLLGGGDDDTAMSARWLIYQQLQHDIRTTAELVASGVAFE